MTTFNQYPGAFGANVLSIALIGPEEQRRKLVSVALAGSREYAVQEYPFYPDLEDVSGLMEQGFDVIMVDLDSDSEYALSLIASICRVGPATVMVYSEQTDSRLLMRCMRAGAREFLTVPVTAETVADALSQVTGRRKDIPPAYPEPNAKAPEPLPYEPVGGLVAQDTRAYRADIRSAGSEIRPRGLYPNYDPAAQARSQESTLARQESALGHQESMLARPDPTLARSESTVARQESIHARQESMLARPEIRPYEPAAGMGNPGVRASNAEPRSYTPEPRSYEPVAGVASSVGRAPVPESRSYEPVAGGVNPGGRVPMPESRPFGGESRPYEPIGGAAAANPRASAPDSRSFNAPENRAYESGGGAANPGTRILNPSSRPSSRSSRLLNHGPRFSNPDVRATNPEVRTAIPEVRPVIPEIRPVAPEPRLAPPEVSVPKKTGGRVLVFLGAKGGSGTTSVACNFSSSLARESGKKTLLIDLHLPLGNVALELGVKPQYSIVDALRNAARLDSNFLSKLLVKHRTGLFVLASPDKFTPIQASKDAIEKLLATARQEFDYVVVDVGAKLDLSELTGTAMLEDSATVYLVTQDNVAELRNSNRLITEYFSSGGPSLEIVLNRYTPRISGIGMYSSHLVDEKHIGAALTKSPEWRIPQDSSDILLPVEGSALERMFQNMARKVCNLEAVSESKRRSGGAEPSQQTISLFK